MLFEKMAVLNEISTIIVIYSLVITILINIYIAYVYFFLFCKSSNLHIFGLIIISIALLRHLITCICIVYAWCILKKNPEINGKIKNTYLHNFLTVLKEYLVWKNVHNFFNSFKSKKGKNTYNTKNNDRKKINKIKNIIISYNKKVNIYSVNEVTNTSRLILFILDISCFIFIVIYVILTANTVINLEEKCSIFYMLQWIWSSIIIMFNLFSIIIILSKILKSSKMNAKRYSKYIDSYNDIESQDDGVDYFQNTREPLIDDLTKNDKYRTFKCQDRKD